MTDERTTNEGLIGEHVRDAVRESETRLRTVVESLPFDFFLIGPDGRYVMQNSACKRNWGDGIGKRPEDLCPDKHTWAMWEANNHRAFAGEVVEGEVAFQSPTGTRYCHNIISPIRDGDEIRGILGINIDITQRVRDRTAQLEASNRLLEAEVEHRKQVEAKLRESEAQYRTLVESAGESIIQVDGEGRFLFLNRTAGQFLGSKPEDYIGKTVRDVFPPEAAQRQLRNVRTVMETGRSVTAEVPVSFHDRTRWFSATFEPLTDATGKVSSVLVVARDVQELRQARKELQAYQDHMARTERLASLGTLSATVAHEMNQPLTVLRLTLQNCLEQLQSNGESTDVIEDLESCLEEVSTAASIVDRFKSFARASSRGRVVHVNLHEIARKVLRIWEESARETKVTFSLEGLDKVPEVYLDERDIEQLFFLFVENAVQAADGRKEHRLAIRGTVTDKVIELAFADDCGGIASKHVGRIFEPFFTTKDSEQATGLGLCIVEHILSRIGGKIRVDNRPGEGVTFVITLPMDEKTRGTA
jgi:PAS domain S-box-containing protein